jgi:hypothetical protein
MTIRVPKAVLIAVAVLLVIGGGVAAVVAIGAGGATCFDADGAEVDCEQEDALTEAEFEQHQAEIERERQASAKAQREAQRCRSQLEGLLSATKELDGRLNIGLSYDAYGTQVGNVSVAYETTPFKDLALECISAAGVPLEDAFNSYAKAADAWSTCFDDFDCDVDSIDPELQKHWADASLSVKKAEAGLTALAKP